MLAGEDSTQVGGKVLVSHSISSSDRQSVIGTVAHHGGRKLENFKIKSELDNLKIKIIREINGGLWNFHSDVTE